MYSNAFRDFKGGTANDRIKVGEISVAPHSFSGRKRCIFVAVKKPNKTRETMIKKMLGAIAGVVVIVGAATSYASPYLTLHEMRSAIADKDADSFASDVDFPAVRESLRAQFIVMMQNQLWNDSELKGNPFAGIGMMLGMGMANQLIDTMVTPAGVMQMMSDASPKPISKSRDAPASDHAFNPADYSVRYRNWSIVAVTGQRESKPPVIFTFKRSGPWSWKLSAVALPSTRLTAN